MTAKAYPYIRFSTAKQSFGDSERRQLELAQAFAVKKNLDFDDSLNLHDYGVTAFTGKNLNEGALGKFIDSVYEGKIAPGSFLLIENMDRFSRMEPRKALRPFLDLVDAGIKVVTLQDERIYDNQMGALELVATLMHMQRAHEESARKGGMIAASKSKSKQLVIAGKKQTLWKWGIPKWIRLNADETGFELIEDRVEIVRKIIEWTIKGFGTTKIIEKIEKLKVSPWTSSEINIVNRKPKQWHSSQIQRIVHNKAIFGTYELSIKDPNTGMLTTHEIENFFPKVVSEELFYQAVAARKSRRPVGVKSGFIGGGGRKGKTVSNLFSKLAVCGYSMKRDFERHCSGDREYMVYVNKDKKTKKGKIRQRYFQCGFAKGNASRCKHCRKAIRYEDFEYAFLSYVKDISAETIFGSKTQHEVKRTQLISDIRTLEGKLTNIQEKYKVISVSIDELDVIPDLLIDKLLDYEAGLKSLPIKIETLQSELMALDVENKDVVEKKYQLDTLIGLQGMCLDDDQKYSLRLQVLELLKANIQCIEVYNVGRQIDIERLKRHKEITEAELQEIVKINEEEATPTFIVKFKSGDERYIKLTKEKPYLLRQNTKIRGGQVVENYLFSHKPFPIVQHKTIDNHNPTKTHNEKLYASCLGFVESVDWSRALCISGHFVDSFILDANSNTDNLRYRAQTIIRDFCKKLDHLVFGKKTKSRYGGKRVRRLISIHRLATRMHVHGLFVFEDDINSIDGEKLINKAWNKTQGLGLDLLVKDHHVRENGYSFVTYMFEEILGGNTDCFDELNSFFE